MDTKTVFHRTAPFLAALCFLVLSPGSGVRAQSEVCTSYTPIDLDAGAAYSVPLHYGTFADVEVGAAIGDTVQLEVTVFEESVVKDRRIWVLVPGRVELLTEILDVENLFQIGDPLLVRMTASGPVSAILVRR